MQNFAYFRPARSTSKPYKPLLSDHEVRFLVFHSRYKNIFVHEQGKVVGLKNVGLFAQQIANQFNRSKTLIYNSLKSPKKYI